MLFRSVSQSRYEIRYGHGKGKPVIKRSGKCCSKKIFGEVIHLGKSSWDLLKDEKQKLQDGKYDMAMEKVSLLLKGLENAVQKSGDPKINEQFLYLTDKRDELLKWNETAKDSNKTPESELKMTEKEKSERLKRLKSLLQETELLMNQLENR